MHLTKFARAWAVSAMVALGFAAAPATAQERPPATPPMVTLDKSGAIPVTIGGQVRFQMKGAKPIKEAFNENDRVVQVLSDTSDPSKVILIGRAAGTSKLELTDTAGNKESYTVIVQRDMELLKTLIRKTVPTAAVEVTPIGDSGTSIILSGYAAREEDRETVRQLSEALGLRVAVNTMAVGGGGNVPHVQLDMTLARVDRSKARSRGATFLVNGNTVSGASILGGLGALGQGGAAAAGAGGAGGSVGIIPQAASVAAGNGANIILGVVPARFNLLLAALKTEGLAKLMAAPTVVARSGENAELRVGSDVPVISPAAGINGPGVTYRPIGTELRVLPVVYGNGKIFLELRPRVSSVNNALALTTTFGPSPAFDTQEMTTSIVMEPGQTVAIGGLIQTQQSGSVTKIPHLGDIPYLGSLFSFSTQTEQEVELVILVTPRLIDPADCGQLPQGLPGSETRKPDDFEFYLETMLEAPRGQRPIWNGKEYIPAWKSSSSANVFPCADGKCATGARPVGGAANCANGSCGTPSTPGTTPMALPPVVPGKASVTPPISTPDAVPLTVVPPASLVPPSVPGRKTAELPAK